MDSAEYRKLAALEDRMWYFRSLHAHVRRALEAAVAAGAENKNTGFRVLDAGCGTGGLIRRLQRAHPDWQITGVDLAPLACELARERCGAEVPIQTGSITALPFADQSFDAVVSADVICQIDDARVACAEFLRVLRPGGTVVINAPAYMWMWSYHDDACQTKHRFTRPEIDQALAAVGFEQRCLTHWNALPFPLVWARRKLFAMPRDTSDIKVQPAAIEKLMDGAMAIEHGWLRTGGRWAWGTSILATARRPVTVAAERRAE